MVGTFTNSNSLAQRCRLEILFYSPYIIPLFNIFNLQFSLIYKKQFRTLPFNNNNNNIK